MEDYSQQNLVINLLTLAAIITALGVIGRLALSARRFFRATGQFLDDWTGQPARPGHRARPGIPQRLEALETGQAEIRAQLRTNDGSSLRDAVDRIPPNNREA